MVCSLRFDLGAELDRCVRTHDGADLATGWCVPFGISRLHVPRLRPGSTRPLPNIRNCRGHSDPEAA